MGVIQRQGIKQSLVTYLSTFIGAINVLFVYTYILTKEELGFYNFFVATANIIMPLALIGTSSVIIRFFPEFKRKENGNNGFLRLILTSASLGLLLSAFLIYFFQDSIQAFYKDKMQGFESLFLLLIPYIIFRGYNTVLAAYAINYQRIAIPAVFNNLFLKIALPIFCILYYYEYFQFKDILIGIITVLALTSFVFLTYIQHLGGLLLQPIDWTFFNKKRRKRVGNFMFFGVLIGLSGNLAFLIDIFMVGSLASISLAASYSIAFFIAEIIDVPKKAINSISSSIIAKAWNENNLNEIKKVYQKASLNLFLYACLILVLIWSSLFDLFAIIPNGEQYIEGTYVVLILGIAKVIDAITSVNDPILSLSKYYKVSFISVLILSIINILNNIWLIDWYQINGAALATLISIFIFNLIKLIFIWYKFGIQPFSWNHLKIFLLALGAYFIGFVLPLDFHPFINIVLRSLAIGFFYIPIVLYLELSEDINNLLKRLLKDFKK